MRFARWVFAVAGIYGLLVLAPMLGMEAQIGREHPPAITHPEYFYGFLGVALAWQVGFLVIATDPVRYRLMILPAILEKASFGTATATLWATRGVPTPILLGASIDLLLMVLFIASWRATRPR
ncbi:MAG TPA: hypothetical protein VFG20_00560 [Planctomycetaceae bacterium]|nr:hypothetical protein [Planctomycetaceae bacterium]